MNQLESLDSQAFKIGEGWSEAEVRETIIAYFDMLRLDALQEPYNKAERNRLLRTKLKGRSKGSVEMKHQNVSAVLDDLELPYVPGYKPRGNAQLLLRKEVQQFVLDNADLIGRIVDAWEEVKPPGEKRYKAVLVEAPSVEVLGKQDVKADRVRLPRRLNYAARDEANRKLGREGEQWALGYEQHRLSADGLNELFLKVDWVADRLGDGLGYDILSYDSADRKRFIEVKTTNGDHTSSFIISRNEVDFSAEVGPQFHLYRIYQFREQPKLYVLKGAISDQLHLEPMDYRASFRKLVR